MQGFQKPVWQNKNSSLTEVSFHLTYALQPASWVSKLDYICTVNSNENVQNGTSPKEGLRETSVLILSSGGWNIPLTECHGYSSPLSQRMKLNLSLFLKKSVRAHPFFSFVFLQSEDFSLDLMEQKPGHSTGQNAKLQDLHRECLFCVLFTPCSRLSLSEWRSHQSCTALAVWKLCL